MSVFFTSTYLKEILFLLGNDKAKLPLLVACFLVIGILDILGISLIVPFVSLVIDPEMLGSAKIDFLRDLFGLTEDSEELLFYLSAALVLTFSLKAFGAIGIHWMIVKFTNLKLAGLRGHLMSSYQCLPYDEYIQRNSSEYIFAMSSLTSTFTARVLLPGLKAISDIIVCAAILVLLAMVSVSVLAYMSAMLFGAVMVYDRFFKNRLRGYGEKKNIAATKMLQRLNEGIKGLKEIRIVNAESYFYRGLVENAQIFSETEAKSQAISAAPRYLLEMLVVFFLVATVAITVFIKADFNELIPVLTMFSLAALRLMPTVSSLLNNILALRLNRNATALLYKDMKDLERIGSVNLASIQSKSVPEPFKEIELRNISYTYPTAKQPALSDICLSIKAGESVGIIGASGAGKTTILDLLLGLLEPNSGTVYFNGKALSSSKAMWMENVAYLPQEIFLADSSLRENVALGLAPEEINDELLIESINKAKLSSLISGLPDGVNTIIGEGGVRLSGGQRQRIALARAFYHRRSVLVFDEATSALDDDIEREIVNEIHQLKGNKTIIMIAHRLSTLSDCDIIVKLEEGRIVDFGSFDKIVGIKNAGRPHY
jgi:ABC-type bacteriocin/lantibiotic exporter with double-glycine peptidase domain